MTADETNAGGRSPSRCAQSQNLSFANETSVVAFAFCSPVCHSTQSGPEIQHLAFVRLRSPSLTCSTGRFRQVITFAMLRQDPKTHVYMCGLKGMESGFAECFQAPEAPEVCFYIIFWSRNAATCEQVASVRCGMLPCGPCSGACQMSRV